jgi:hypothetical protein
MIINRMWHRYGDPMTVVTRDHDSGSSSGGKNVLETPSTVIVPTLCIRRSSSCTVGMTATVRGSRAELIEESGISKISPATIHSSPWAHRLSSVLARIPVTSWSTGLGGWT